MKDPKNLSRLSTNHSNGSLEQRTAFPLFEGNAIYILSFAMLVPGIAAIIGTPWALLSVYIDFSARNFPLKDISTQILLGIGQYISYYMMIGFLPAAITAILSFRFFNLLSANKKSWAVVILLNTVLISIVRLLIIQKYNIVVMIIWAIATLISLFLLKNEFYASKNVSKAPSPNFFVRYIAIFALIGPIIGFILFILFEVGVSGIQFSWIPLVIFAYYFGIIPAALTGLFCAWLSSRIYTNLILFALTAFGGCISSAVINYIIGGSINKMSLVGGLSAIFCLALAKLLFKSRGTQVKSA